jgi:hypothetical protein
VSADGDMLFSMSPEPAPGFHTRMMHEQRLASAATLATRDPSLESLFARPSPAKTRSKASIASPARPAAARSVSAALPQDAAADPPWLYSFPTPTTPTRTGISLPYHSHRRAAPSTPDLAASPPMVVRSFARRFDRASSHAKGGPPPHAGPPPAQSPLTSSSSSASSSRFSSPERASSAATSVASSPHTVSSRLCDAFMHDVRLGTPPARFRPPPRAPAAAPRVSLESAASFRADEGLMRKAPLAAYADPMQARGRRRPGLS